MQSGWKQRIKTVLDRIGMFREFYQDYRAYKKWNYHNPKVHTRGAQEAKILRHTHMIEKGLSLSAPRKGFGTEKIRELLGMLDEYISLGFPTDGVPFVNAVCVLHQYVAFQNTLGFENAELNQRLETLRPYVDEAFTAGVLPMNLETLKQQIHGDFPTFFASRHSVRQFSERKIDVTDVKKAVALARKAPTACNRQACKVYFYSDPNTNQELGKLIAGNTGFDGEVQNYLVITADISAFYDTFERNQLYVEAGIFGLSLVQALHYYGIASCILQNGEYVKKNRKFKEICGNIPENEKIALFVAIGYYKDSFHYAVSHRKNTDDILTIS